MVVFARRFKSPVRPAGRELGSNGRNALLDFWAESKDVLLKAIAVF